MRTLILCIISSLLLANSSFAVKITTIEQLDGLAEFSFSAFGDNNGYAARHYTVSGDAKAKGMARLEPFIKNNDAFVLGSGDHAIGNRKTWYQMNETDSFWHNHYYPVLGDNCNETDYFYGVTGNQAHWGRGWVMFKALNNFINRNTAIDQITFRPKGTNKVYSAKSKAEPDVMVPYDDQLCDYYAKRIQGKFTFHIIGINIPNPGVMAPVTKNFMMSKLNQIAAAGKTDYDVVIVNAQQAKWVQRAKDRKWMTAAEVDTLMTVADLILCGDDHIYRRQSEFDAVYNGTGAIWMNVGQPCVSTGAGRGYLNFHMFDNPPRFTVQYIFTETESTRKLHVNAVQLSSTQRDVPAAHTKPYLKYINGPYVSVDWNNFQLNSTPPPVTLTNGASFVSQSVPSSMVAGTTSNVTVKMKNTGTAAWKIADGHKLGSQNPQGNSTWGFSRVDLPSGVTVAAGQEYTFSFAIKAPTNAGTYNFQWKMVDDIEPNPGWFGALTANKAITVTAATVNKAPYFTSNPFSLADATTGAAYNQSFSAKAVDPESGTKAFVKVAGPSWLDVSGAGNATGTPGTVDVGTNSFTVKVTDNGGLSATATMTIKVNRAVTLPVVSFIAPTNLTVQAGSTLYVNVGASDPDGIDRVRLYKDGAELARSEGEAPYEWNGTNQVDPELQNLQAGSFVLTAKATDTVGSVGEKSITITVAGGIPSVGSTISLKAVNGKYVSATYSTNNTLIASKTTVSNYEKFKVVNATNGVALQCVGNSKFVSIDALNGSKPMIANRTKIGNYEKFKLVQSGSQIAIQSVANTNYVSAVSNGLAPLRANQTYIGSYEKFTWKVE